MRIFEFSKSLKALAALALIVTAIASEATIVQSQTGSCGTICLYYCPGDPHGYCQTQYGGLCGLKATCSGGDPCIPGLTIALQCGVGAVE